MEQARLAQTGKLFRIGTALALGASTGCTSLAEGFERRAREELARQPLAPPRLVTEADAAHLPAPVRRYLARTGAFGRPQVQRFRVTMDADLYRKPGGSPISGPVVQYSFAAEPARLFLMRARMYGLPVLAFHDYAQGKARMRVRVASLFDVNDVSGAEMDRGETVTFLNDLCILAPSLLVDRRFSWEVEGERAARVTLESRGHRVSAELRFDEAGDLVDFVSEDRAELQPDGTLRRLRWSTPLSEYRDMGGRRLASRGEAVYHRPGGPFTYGVFRIRSVEYDVDGFR
ncbi:MAG: hypothetical protein HZB56_07350 [Deltaproteobacteria bacterium]|nr:hypothetical protein [Deltaproteobacteria bacterium]